MKLTEGQLEIMNYLWAQDEPVLREDVIENATHEAWLTSSFYTIIDRLMDNGFVKIVGYERKKGRTFQAAISRKEYMKTHIAAVSAPMTDFVSTWLMDDDIPMSELIMLKKVIQSRLDEMDKNE